MSVAEEIRAEHKKLKGKGFKAHFSYFMTYYKWPTVAVIAVLVIGISLIRSILSNKPAAVNAMFLNGSNTDLTYSTDWIENDFIQYAGIDTGKYSVTIDTSSYITPGGAQSQVEAATSMKIMAYSAAKDLDVLTSDPYNFHNYARSGMFTDLRDVLSEEQIEKYSPYFYYIDGKEIEEYENTTSLEDQAAQAESDAAYTGSTAAEDADESTDAETEGADATADIDSNPLTAEADAKAAALLAEEKVDVFVSPDPSEMEDPIPVGVILTEAPYFSTTGFYGDIVPICGVLVSSERQDMGVKMLDYLWEH